MKKIILIFAAIVSGVLLFLGLLEGYNYYKVQPLISCVEAIVEDPEKMDNILTDNEKIDAEEFISNFENKAPGQYFENVLNEFKNKEVHINYAKTIDENGDELFAITAYDPDIPQSIIFYFKPLDNGKYKLLRIGF